MQQSCGPSRKSCKNGMDWNGPSKAPFWTLDLMDLTIVIKQNRITTTLFEKQLNIYLYIPPHSDPPPGVINEIVYVQIHRINILCYIKGDKKILICQ